MVVRRLLSVWDYVILGATLLVSISVGVGYGCLRGGQHNTREFLSANRQLGVVSTAISICVSFINAIMLMGVSSEMYFFGTMFSISVFSILLAGLLSQVFIPLFYPLGLTSVYEYLELRYQSRTVRSIGVLLFITEQTFFMGFASFAPATALEAVSGIPVWTTILINGLVATIYTALGGIKAVIWTDVIQCVVMISGLLAIVIQGSTSVGGLPEVWRLCEKWGRIDFVHFETDPTIRHTFWSVMLGSTWGWLARFSVSQASVQRFGNVSSLRKARCAVMMNTVIGMTLMGSTSFAGVIVFAYYASRGCDPLSAGSISSTNQILPFFVVDVLNYPGVPGLFVACLFSGALSTISSGLSALSAVVWKDVLSGTLGPKLSESQRTTVTKVLVLVFGSITIGSGFFASALGGQILQAAISFLGAVSGPLLGLFILSAFFPCANWKGASAGALIGFGLTVWLSVGANLAGVKPTPLPLPSSSCPSLNPLPYGNLTEGAAISNFSLLTTSASSVTSDVTLLGVTSLAPNWTTGTPSPPLQGLNYFYHLSYLYYSTFGILNVVSIGLIISFLTGHTRSGEVDPQYLISVCDWFCCCLPESVRASCRPKATQKMKALEHELENLYVHVGSHVQIPN